MSRCCTTKAQITREHKRGFGHFDSLLHKHTTFPNTPVEMLQLVLKLVISLTLVSLKSKIWLDFHQWLSKCGHHWRLLLISMGERGKYRERHRKGRGTHRGGHVGSKLLLFLLRDKVICWGWLIWKLYQKLKNNSSFFPRVLDNYLVSFRIKEKMEADWSFSVANIS